MLLSIQSVRSFVRNVQIHQAPYHQLVLDFFTGTLKFGHGDDVHFLDAAVITPLEALQGLLVGIAANPYDMAMRHEDFQGGCTIEGDTKIYLIDG